MRLWILSDLHLRHGERLPPVPDADVAVVAGDLCEGVAMAAAQLADEVRPRMPVIFVPGNHEFYGSAMNIELVAGRRVADALGVHLLDDGIAKVGGATFAGASLWTDYRADGDHRRGAAMAAASGGMRDHVRIAESFEPAWRPFRPKDALVRHEASRAFLEALADDRPPGPLVVVTHHAPSAACLDPRFEGDPLNPAFASALDPLVERLGADLWVHGHVHAGVDLRIGRTRVLCNPRGHPGENPAFDPALVVEI